MIQSPCRGVVPSWSRSSGRAVYRMELSAPTKNNAALIMARNVHRCLRVDDTCGGNFLIRVTVPNVRFSYYLRTHPAGQSLLAHDHWAKQRHRLATKVEAKTESRTPPAALGKLTPSHKRIPLHYVPRVDTCYP